MRLTAIDYYKVYNGSKLLSIHPILPDIAFDLGEFEERFRSKQLTRVIRWNGGNQILIVGRPLYVTNSHRVLSQEPWAERIKRRSEMAGARANSEKWATLGDIARQRKAKQ